MIVIVTLIHQILIKLPQVICRHGVKANGITMSSHYLTLKMLKMLQFACVMLMVAHRFLFHRVVLDRLLALVNRTELVTFSSLSDVDVGMIKLLDYETKVC